MTSGGMAGQEPARDTVLVMVAPSGALDPGDWGIIAFALLASVGVVALLVFLRRVEMHGRRLTAIARRMDDRSRPVLEHAAGIGDNLEGIIRSLRAEAEHLTGSVRALSNRLRQASAHLETRIDEFNALLEVVQAEAEETFLKTASAVRGVSAGARAFDGGRKGARPELAEDVQAFPDHAEADPVPALTDPVPADGRDPPAEAG